MGRSQGRVEITASLSSHNDPRDDTDRELWANLVERVRQIVDDSMYAEIDPMLWNAGE